MSRKLALRASALAVVVFALSGLGAVRGSSIGAVADLRDAGAEVSATQPSSGGVRSLSRRAATATAVPACDGPLGVVCSEVVVPIDRSAGLPGTITLHVESLPALGAERGVMVLLAGGPGQGSAGSFDIGSPDNANLFRFLFPGYRLVAFDNRGTGSSGLLDCPALQDAFALTGQDRLAARCAAKVGPARDYYGTRDHAEDIEAVRVAVGAGKIGLWGTSYGTKLALAYALAHPDHVERLLLDSVLPTELPDPYEGNVLRDMPLALANFCADGVCRAATPDFADDVVTLANRLARKPVAGRVRQANGSSRSERMGGLDLLALVVDADLNPGLAAELPAAVRAARLGDPRPLLRLYALHVRGSEESAEELSAGLYAATTCTDGRFPWQRETPLADRPARIRSAIAGLPVGTLGRFGRWAAEFGTASFCLQWPSAAVETLPLGSGPLPDVPVLEVSGGFDMRTPTSSATTVSSLFPQARVLVVPSVGHSTVSADPSFCAPRAVRQWILDGTVPARCARPKFTVLPIGAYPRTGRIPPRAPGPRATLALVRKTLSEATATWVNASSGKGATIAGLTSGKLQFGQGRSFRLTRYGISPGVEVSGRLSFDGKALPVVLDGVLTVTGPGAAHGIIGVSRGKLAGTLGGTVVG